jgi:allophanate hydrolase
VTTFTRTVAAARPALAALVGFDPDDPWSRPAPATPPPGIAGRMRVLAVPAGLPFLEQPDGQAGLDPLHQAAWRAALAYAEGIAARLVPVDIGPFLAAARLLYQGPFLAERWAGFGRLLDADGVDPTVRAIVSAGRDLAAADLFDALDALARLRRATEPIWAEADALLLPVTPGHPRLAEVAADPVGVNSRLGSYTNFVNLLDLCAVAVPAGNRADGLPFGVQLIAPAFADGPLLDLAARWCAEPVPETAEPAGDLLVAVCGAHMSGLPLNPELIRLGGSLAYRAGTAPGYRLFRLPGIGVPRPGLVPTGDGPAQGIPLEVWRLPAQAVGALLATVPAPLALGPVRLADGTVLTGFLSTVADGEDISGYGGWRGYLATGS